MRDLIIGLGMALLLTTAILGTALLMKRDHPKGTILEGTWECTDSSRHTGECFEWTKR